MASASAASALRNDITGLVSRLIDSGTRITIDLDESLALAIIVGILAARTPCKPLDWNHDHDYHDHDGSAPLMGANDINLVEAF